MYGPHGEPLPAVHPPPVQHRWGNLLTIFSLTTIALLLCCLLSHGWMSGSGRTAFNQVHVDVGLFSIRSKQIFFTPYSNKQVEGQSRSISLAKLRQSLCGEQDDSDSGGGQNFGPFGSSSDSCTYVRSFCVVATFTILFILIQILCRAAALRLIQKMSAAVVMVWRGAPAPTVEPRRGMPPLSALWSTLDTRPYYAIADVPYHPLDLFVWAKLVTILEGVLSVAIVVTWLIVVHAAQSHLDNTPVIGIATNIHFSPGFSLVFVCAVLLMCIVNYTILDYIKAYEFQPLLNVTVQPPPRWQGPAALQQSLLPQWHAPQTMPAGPGGPGNPVAPGSSPPELQVRSGEGGVTL
ncbi:unnamed protein product [Vitrella brassicaformis CCMP3155]|uniref:Uncharacterized protein n=2 Tax=Vitrella brassicaformis TaxID=1169539 RepID=A0A0G4ELN5_VITBC|nr:unnamed protein product [Vitrella brassicaformis CCMP3155]|mmetsp:Transcript_14694/g.35039  ORF Transcript_14694/g.35039 Transcript_14694/m.35039 type:complete len:350 (+) Transcript_14694:185-1234(+)|eukprot:CEL97743.1 unnamed protein product [Vitrella brassicaformis CCMP3155]